jgi:hypothetical protein
MEGFFDYLNRSLQGCAQFRAGSYSGRRKEERPGDQGDEQDRRAVYINKR